MDLDEFTARLDDELRTDAYADLDASPNGLQVGPESGELDHVAFAVDAARATIEAALDAGADAMVTHHGLIWGGLDRVTGRDYDRLEPLFEGDLALYVSHLPLDGHQSLGNAAGLLDLLGTDVTDPFGELGPEVVGQRGRLTEPRSLADIVDELDAELHHAGEIRSFDFGPDEIEDVAVVTGSGADWLDEAAAAGADLLLTGEGKQKLYHEAREAGVSVVLAGHYATETVGVRALQALAEEWGLATTYIDHPTGL